MREGMGFELCPRVVPFQQTEIWGVGFCMGGDIFWKEVYVGVKEGPLFGGGNGGGGSGGGGEGTDGDGRGNCGWEEGPASGWVFSRHIFFAAPSPLSLLLFRFVDVSMFSIVLFFFLVPLGDGAAGVLGVTGFLWAVGFFGVAAGDCVVVLDAAADTVGSVDVVAAGDSVVVVVAAAAAAAAGGSDVVVAAAAGVGALVCFWGGDVIGLFSPCLGDPLLFLVTSVQPSWLFLGWTWPGPLASASLLMVMVVAAMSFVVVVVVDAFSLFSGRWGQNLAICPTCLHPQHLGRLPSTITIICRSPQIRVSGMALKPSLVRHSRKA